MDSNCEGRTREIQEDAGLGFPGSTRYGYPWSRDGPGATTGFNGSKGRYQEMLGLEDHQDIMDLLDHECPKAELRGAPGYKGQKGARGYNGQI